MPLVKRTRATLRSAEFGFFGVCVKTRTQTPRFCGLSWSAGLFVLVATFSRRGLAVVISDFFAPGNGVIELLRQLEGQRQEVIVFHVLAPEELDLPYETEVIMEDSETGEELPVHAEAFRAEYQSRLNEFCKQIEQECTKLEIDYQRLRTDSPLDAALIAYLEKRAAL